MSNEYGPSWRDAGDLARTMVARGYQAPEVRLVPNWRLDDRKSPVRWVLVVSIRRRGKGEGQPFYAQCTFGPGEAVTTAPAALWRALESALDQANAEERRAVSQAAF